MLDDCRFAPRPCRHCAAPEDRHSDGYCPGGADLPGYDPVGTCERVLVQLRLASGGWTNYATATPGSKELADYLTSASDAGVPSRVVSPTAPPTPTTEERVLALLGVEALPGCSPFGTVAREVVYLRAVLAQTVASARRWEAAASGVPAAEADAVQDDANRDALEKQRADGDALTAILVGGDL